jgi:hypothetical protein
MIFYLLSSVLVVSLFIDMVERRFPNEFNNFMIKSSFNCIYFYSKLQIKLVQINNNFNNFIEKRPTLLKIKKDLDTLMNPKNDIFPITQFFKNGKSIDITESSNIEYDFAIYSFLDNDKKCVNKKIIYDINQQTNTFEYSDIKFIQLSIKIEESTIYKIDLKTYDYNYYLVGNKFTKEFFCYYLINYLNVDETILNECKMSIQIIDHHVNILEIDFTNKIESIIIFKDDYICKTNNNED